MREIGQDPSHCKENIYYSIRKFQICLQKLTGEGDPEEKQRKYMLSELQLSSLWPHSGEGGPSLSALDTAFIRLVQGVVGVQFDQI